ncbi:hypothetical protein AB6866_20370 [Rahnella inusitata]
MIDKISAALPLLYQSLFACFFNPLGFSYLAHFINAKKRTKKTAA